MLSQQKAPSKPHPQGLQSSCPNSPVRGTSCTKGFCGCVEWSSHELSSLERVTLCLTVPAELSDPDWCQAVQAT